LKNALIKTEASVIISISTAWALLHTSIGGILAIVFIRKLRASRNTGEGGVVLIVLNKCAIDGVINARSSAFP